jgi:hypothetical protein
MALPSLQQEVPTFHESYGIMKSMLGRQPEPNESLRIREARQPHRLACTRPITPLIAPQPRFDATEDMHAGLLLLEDVCP